MAVSRSLAFCLGAALLASLASGCRDAPSDAAGVGELTLAIGHGAGEWTELLDGDALPIVLGPQGLLMLPLRLRAVGVEGDPEAAWADFRGVMTDDESVEVDRVGSSQPLERLDSTTFQGPETELIASTNDPLALAGREIELTVTLHTEGKGLGGGEPTVLGRVLRLEYSAPPDECVYPDEAQMADSPLFTDVTDEAGLDIDHGDLASEPDCLFSRGGDVMDYCSPEYIAGEVAVGDYDADGWPDVFMTSPYSGHHLLHNRGDGTFEDRSDGSGIVTSAPTSGAAWLDADEDGDLDLYLTSISGTRHHLFIQGLAGTFADEALDRGAAVDTGIPHAGTSVAVGDYDGDGYLDVYAGEWIEGEYIGSDVSHARLLRNLGTSAPGHFEDTTIAAGVSVDGLSANARGPGAYVHTPAFVDLDGDGLLDLALTSDFGTSRLFWNQGDGSFTDGTSAAGVGTDGYGMGAAFADFDADGDVDWFVSSITQICSLLPRREGNRLYVNQGNRVFDERAEEAGVFDGGWGWGALFFDHDNDADLDLFHAAGWPNDVHRHAPMRFHRNDGSLPFTEVAQELGLNDLGQGRGVATFDYDGDGDLDLLIGRHADTPLLYRNDSPPTNGWLRVQLFGGASNSRGIGARVSVRTSPGATEQVRWMGVDGHFMAQSEAIAHFGLGPGSDPVSEVRVEWPVSGEVQVFTDVARNQLLTIIEPG